MIRSLKTAILAGALAVFAAPALAAPITGTITFGGVPVPVGGTNFFEADTIDFLGAGVTGVSGDFQAAGIIPFTTPATFNAINYRAPATSFTLWEVAGFTFEVDSLTIIDEADLVNAPNFLDLRGTGVVSATNFDDTPATWSLSTDDSGGQLLAFSASTTANPTPVPVPATVLLFGAGVVAVFGVAARRSQTA